MLDPKRLAKSFYYAGRGLAYILKTEQNFRLQFFGAIFVIFWMFYYDFIWIKIVFISFLFLLILSLEIINTIFEEITDFLAVERRKNPLKGADNPDFAENNLIGHVKNLSAALVLFACIISLFLAIAIFLKI